MQHVSEWICACGLAAGALGLTACESKSGEQNAREEVFGESSRDDMNARLDAYAEPAEGSEPDEPEEAPSAGPTGETAPPEEAPLP